jgi:REP element-mobilizing transposase RayT
MPRPSRTHAVGVVHHVMIRGVDGRAIFSCNTDYEDFLTRFAFLVRELSFLVLAYCLLGNHAHLVLKSGTVPLAVLMARLTSRHAQRFNRMNDRAGHLFQSRYKAVLIESDAQLVTTIPYVLGNAARHALITPDAALDYPWSMLSALVGRRAPREFEDGRAVAEALGLEQSKLHERVAEVALAPGASGARLEPNQVDELERLIRDCCMRHGIERDALRSRPHEGRAARVEICSLAASALDLSLAAIARHSGVSYDAMRRIAGRRR